MICYHSQYRFQCNQATMNSNGRISIFVKNVFKRRHNCLAYAIKIYHADEISTKRYVYVVTVRHTHNIILAHKNTIFTRVQWKHNAMSKVNTKQHFKLWNSHQTNRISCWVAGIFPFYFSWILNVESGKCLYVVLLRWWSDKNCSLECAYASKRTDRIHIQDRIWAIFLEKLSENSNGFSLLHCEHKWNARIERKCLSWYGSIHPHFMKKNHQNKVN